MWNRDLDEVEKVTLYKLKEAGYKAVDKKHMIHFKEIYNFICRFADPVYSGNVRLTMSDGNVPTKTLGIVNTIGADKLYLYFSQQAYPTKFFRFCEKLIRTKHIRSQDYISSGTIIATEYTVEVIEYKG